MPWWKNIRHTAAQEVTSRRAQKLFRRGADHHCAGILREKQQAVFEAGHHGIHVFAQGTEDFVNAAELLPYLQNFLAHLAEFVRAAARFLRRSCRSIVYADRNALELRQDVADGCE